MKNKRTNLRANASTSRQPNRATGTLIRPRPKEAPFGIRKVLRLPRCMERRYLQEFFQKSLSDFKPWRQVFSRDLE